MRTLSRQLWFHWKTGDNPKRCCIIEKIFSREVKKSFFSSKLKEKFSSGNIGQTSESKLFFPTAKNFDWKIVWCIQRRFHFWRLSISDKLFKFWKTIKAISGIFLVEFFIIELKPVTNSNKKWKYYLVLPQFSFDPKTSFVATKTCFWIQFNFLDSLWAFVQVEMSDDRHQSNFDFQQSKPHCQTSPGPLSETKKSVPGKG